MKKLLCIFFVIFFTLLVIDSFAQKGSLFPWGKTLEQLVGGLSTSSESDIVPTMSCTPRDQPGECTNFILNNDFTPSGTYNPNNASMYQDPFTVAPPTKPGYVPEWNAAQGTPNIDDVYARFAGTPAAPPSPATGYAFMYASNYDGSTPRNEGIVQKIPSLITGHKYGLSFFKMLSRLLPDFPSATGKLNIVLMHCSDYSSIYPQPDIFTTPDLPAHAQQVYCETGMTNTTWQQKLISFVADEDYDMIWIFSKGNSGEGCAINFAYPELKDVTGFTAGSDPAAPTPDNCTVTIGPTTPNACTFNNSVFTWHGPHGQTITAAPDQQLQVDASDPDNVGTWTLTMTIAGEVAASNACGQVLSASVNVVACQNYWPKIYSTADGYFGLLKDNTGNIILSSTGVWGNSIYYNHVGATPSTNIFYETFHFTGSGITNWMIEDEYPVFAFNSGIIETKSSTNPIDQFYNGTTGAAATAPVTLSSNEHVIAETNSGAFITTLANDFYVHSTSGVTSCITGFTVYYHKFNPNTNNLIVYGETAIHDRIFVIYYFNGTTLTASFTSYPSITLFTQIVQVDNSDRCYFLDGNSLYEYNYTTPSTPSTLISITGFNNNNLFISFPGGGYTSDQYFVFNQADEKIYALDFSISNPGCKKIQTTNFSLTGSFGYEVDGDNFYLVGHSNYTGAIDIGSQHVPDCSTYTGVQVYIAKLSLQNDFTNRTTEALERTSKPGKTMLLSISPNPANSTITLKVLKNNKLDKEVYSIAVTNRLGNIVLVKSNCQSEIKLNVTDWGKGIYYVEVINSKGEKSSIPFFKM